MALITLYGVATELTIGKIALSNILKTTTKLFFTAPHAISQYAMYALRLSRNIEIFLF